MRVALVWHGDREARDHGKLEEHRLGPTAQAFREEGVEPEACVYNDDFIGEVFSQLVRVDAVQVWVNPIEQGRPRSLLDSMLAEVARSGVLVSAHPDTIQKMGTKDVVYDTRKMGWGSDVHRIGSVEQMRSELPGRLSKGSRVLKQRRGHSGQGVWKVSATDDPAVVVVRHAARGSSEQTVSLDQWVDSCGEYLEAGPMLDQPYNDRIGDGMVRCYLVRDRVEGFGHQQVNALVPGTDPGPRLYYPPDKAEFQDLKAKMEGEWVPEMLATLGMSLDRLPMLWDADLMFREGGGYILCEINVSSVFPYPESAMRPLARAFKAHAG